MYTHSLVSKHHLCGVHGSSVIGVDRGKLDLKDLDTTKNTDGRMLTVLQKLSGLRRLTTK